MPVIPFGGTRSHATTDYVPGASPRCRNYGNNSGNILDRYAFTGARHKNSLLSFLGFPSTSSA